MNNEAQQATLACIETLSRQASLDEAFADELGNMSLVTGSSPDGAGLTRTMLAMARGLRVTAIRCRANAAGLKAKYEAHQGVGTAEHDPADARSRDDQES